MLDQLIKNLFELKDNDLQIISWNKETYDYLNLNKDKFRESLYRFGFKNLNLILVLKEQQHIKSDLQKHKTKIFEIKKQTDENSIYLYEPNDIKNYTSLSNCQY